MCVEGATLRDIHKVSVQRLAKSLRQLGIVNLSKQGVQQIIMQVRAQPQHTLATPRALPPSLPLSLSLREM